MNPEGMIALLNYREDGITRQYPLPFYMTEISLILHLYSLLHFLEGRP